MDAASIKVGVAHSAATLSSITVACSRPIIEALTTSGRSLPNDPGDFKHLARTKFQFPKYFIIQIPIVADVQSLQQTKWQNSKELTGNLEGFKKEHQRYMSVSIFMHTPHFVRTYDV